MHQAEVDEDVGRAGQDVCMSDRVQTAAAAAGRDGARGPFLFAGSGSDHEAVPGFWRVSGWAFWCV